MIGSERIMRLVEEYPECREAFGLQSNWENEAAFQKLISLRGTIPDELYGACLYMLYVHDIEDVLFSTLQKAFDDVDRHHIMDEEDLDKYDVFPEKITIYRGTENPKETVPRISWSLSREVAHRFGTAHMFKAVIDKGNVLAYFSKNGDEEEIVAVVEDFELLY